MKKLNPLQALIYFENKLPSFLSGDGDIKVIIKELKGSLEDEDSLNYHANILSKGKNLIKRILAKAIEYLSNEADTPKNKAIKNIIDYVDAFTTFEEMLFGLDPKYRDHTLHSLWVYLFGHKFITSMGGYKCVEIAGQMSIIYYKDNKPKFILSADKIKSSTDEHLEAMWAMISIIHDLGYPVEAISNKPQEVFGRILAPFAIEFSSVLQTDLGARINFLYQNICDLLSTRYRPLGLTSEKVEDCFIKAEEELRKRKLSGPITFIGEASISKDKALEMDFKIASVDKNHAAWSAILAFKNINYLHESEYRGGGNRDYLYLLTKRDILNSIVHDTIEEPKDEAINRFQFILLLIDDIEEAARYSRGGQERGLVSNYCDLQWEVTDKRAIVELDYSNYDYDPEIKYQEIMNKYKAQITRNQMESGYEIKLMFRGNKYSNDLILYMSKDA